jgi:hypothetical protein
MGQRKLNLLLAIILVLAFLGCAQPSELREKEVGEVSVKLPFTTFPRYYTCDGADVSPEIRISGIAESAKSVVIIMDDPDAPFGTFTHWIIWNLPVEKELILPEAFPKESIVEMPLKALQGINDFKKIGYGGPCPPPGKPHRYFFKVYVLKEELDLKPGSSRKDLEKAMEGKIIQYGEAMATYGK